MGAVCAASPDQHCPAGRCLGVQLARGFLTHLTSEGGASWRPAPPGLPRAARRAALLPAHSRLFLTLQARLVLDHCLHGSHALSQLPPLTFLDRLSAASSGPNALILLHEGALQDRGEG